MPGSSVYNISNLLSKYAKTKPHYYLLIIILIIILTIFSKRIFGLSLETYYSISASVVLAIGFVFLMSTFLYVYEIKDSGGYIEGVNNLFNSQGGKNFITIIILLLFVIYIYEFPMYGNNEPHAFSMKVTDQLGRPPLISNKFMGIFMIFVFGIFTAYSMMITSNEVPEAP